MRQAVLNSAKMAVFQDNNSIPFGAMGEFVYLRTYSPYDHEQGRRENFFETTARWINYNIGLDTVMTERERYNEASEMLEHATRLGVFPSGRTMWVGGRTPAFSSPQANFNCSFRAVDSFDAFADIMELSMVGSGIGFSVEHKYISGLIGLRKVEINLEPYQPLAAEQRRDSTWTQFVSPDEAIVHVGDSRSGWVSALRESLFLCSTQSEIKKINYNFDNVRDEGEVLKTFGGRASGPYPLYDLFSMIHLIGTLQEEAVYSAEEIQIASERGHILPELTPGRWTSIMALDLANMIGQCVVVGGVRRTAQIALGDSNDEAFRTAKSNLWDPATGQVRKPWRTCSNNSVMFYEKPDRQEIDRILHTVRDNGEPGFINAAEASRRRPNFAGLNPCAEILLDNRGVCNLSTVNVSAYIEDGKLNLDKLLDAFVLATRIGVRQTCVDLSLPEWSKVQKRDRLVGVSMTGWVDMLEALGKWEDKEWQAQLLRVLRSRIHQECDEYSERLGIPRPLLATTVKPEGTLSKIPTVSSGLHPNMAPYYLRRVRTDAKDPVALTARMMGIPVEPLIGNNLPTTLDEAKTWVFEFPVKTKATRTTYEFGAIEMLEQYKMFMEHYVDHNASNTIYVRDDEWDAVGDWLYENWDIFVGISFMRFFDARNAPFPQMPEQIITEEEYEERIKNFPREFDYKLLEAYDQMANHNDIVLMEDACASGACPVR